MLGYQSRISVRASTISTGALCGPSLRRTLSFTTRPVRCSPLADSSGPEKTGGLAMRLSVRVLPACQDTTATEAAPQASPSFSVSEKLALYGSSSLSSVKHLRLLVGKDSVADALLRHFTHRSFR